MSHILAFYLILLSAVPCCAIDNCPDDKADLPADAGQTNNHQKDNGDCGTCSPFFSCEGCAAATIAYHPLQFDFSITIPSSVFTQYQEQMLAKADLDFWQPPKIG